MAALRANTPNFERIYTNEEFEALPSDYQHYELIKGRLVEKMPGGDQPSRIALRLEGAILFYDIELKLGLPYRDANFRIAPGFEPIPDLAYVKAERLPPETSGVLGLRPDLAVEIHSTSDLASVPARNAANNKIAEYLKNNVPLVWAINPALRNVEVYHPDQSTPVQVLDINDELDGENIILGFKMKVSDLFV